MQDNWQRIEQIIKWTGLPSVSAFAREIGLNRSENLYQIKRGNNGISKDLAESINTRFPEISKAWLLTGEGGMIKGDGHYRSYDIPFYKEDAVRVAAARDMNDPDHFISFPILDGVDFAAFSMSPAMEPEIPRGSMLFFQQVAPETVIPGETYLVESDLFTGIRYLRREPRSGDIRLVAANRKDFDEVIVPLDSVNKLYLVRGILIGKGV